MSNEEKTFLLAMIDDEVVCDYPLNEDYDYDPTPYLIDIYDMVFDIAQERFGSMFKYAPYLSKESGVSEDARTEEILSGEQLWRTSEECGSVFDSGLLVGDDINNTFNIYVFSSDAIQYLYNQNWDELEQPSIEYCSIHGIQY